VAVDNIGFGQFDGLATGKVMTRGNQDCQLLPSDILAFKRVRHWQSEAAQVFPKCCR
jgi:hypothetical protein